MKKLIFITLIACVSILAFSCKKDNGGMHTVKYSIEGASTSDVTYTDGNGNIQSATNVDANWTYSYSSSRHGMPIKLTVISKDATQVIGKIFIDGQQAAEQTGVTGNVSLSAVLP